MDIRFIPAFVYSVKNEEYDSPIIGSTLWDKDIPLYSNIVKNYSYFNEDRTTDDLEDWSYGVKNFMADFLKNGMAKSFCPKCGKEVFSQHSFPVFCEFHAFPIFYRFNCCFQYFILIGFPSPRLMGILIPQLRCFYSFFNYNNLTARKGWGRDELFELCQVLFWLLKKYEDDANLYFTHRGIFKLNIISAFHPNMCHGLREELPFIFKISRGGHELISKDFILGKYDFFGIKDLVQHFKQLDSDNPQEVAEAIFAYAMKNKLFLVRPGCDQHMPESLSCYLVDIALQKEASVVYEFKKRLNGFNPIIWITLRSHSRCWINQTQGIISIMKGLHARFPSIGFVFDGHISAMPIYEEIFQNIPFKTSVFNGLGTKVPYESLALFSVIDFFIIPYSNANAFPAIIPKPGIIHGPSCWMPRTPFQILPQKHPVLSIPVGGEIVASGVPSVDSNPYIANYDVDSNDILKEMFALIDNNLQTSCK